MEKLNGAAPRGRKAVAAAELFAPLPDDLPQPPTLADDVLRIGRALATGAQGRGLGSEVCARLYGELRAVWLALAEPQPVTSHSRAGRS